MRDLEHQLQVACIRWFDMQYPALRPLLFAVPNGGQRNQVVAAKLKAEGVRPGVADLILLMPNANHNSLCLELKAGKNKQSEHQIEWESKATIYGNKYVVIRSVEEFIETINEYLCGEL